MKTSIIITCYNYSNYVERAIRSCMHQQMVGHSTEIIVVNDASEDDTATVLKKFHNQSMIRVITNEENLGVAEAANVAIRAAFGQYVVRVDADDFVSEFFVFSLQQYLEYNHEALGVACDYVLVDNNENSIRRCYAEDEPISCGVMYRRDLLIEAGLYNPRFRQCEELELRRRLGGEYCIHYLRMPLYRYRKHGENKTGHSDYDRIKSSLFNTFTDSS